MVLLIVLEDLYFKLYITSSFKKTFMRTSPQNLKLVIMRHGQSTWNLENRFTGWHDVDLTPEGVREAVQAGKEMKAKGYSFDVGYTSLLKRSIQTYNLIADELDCNWIPIHKSWRLNERHYGAL